jgi:hypothetical protein
MCTNWHQGELKNRNYYRQQLASMPQCPCISFFLFFDGQFGFRTIDWTNGVLTAPVRQRSRYAPHGKVGPKFSSNYYYQLAIQQSIDLTYEYYSHVNLP